MNSQDHFSQSVRPAAAYCVSTAIYECTFKDWKEECLQASHWNIGLSLTRASPQLLLLLLSFYQSIMLSIPVCLFFFIVSSCTSPEWQARLFAVTSSSFLFFPPSFLLLFPFHKTCFCSKHWHFDIQSLSSFFCCCPFCLFRPGQKSLLKTLYW